MAYFRQQPNPGGGVTEQPKTITMLMDEQLECAAKIKALIPDAAKDRKEVCQRGRKDGPWFNRHDFKRVAGLKVGAKGVSGRTIFVDEYEAGGLVHFMTRCQCGKQKQLNRIL